VKGSLAELHGAVVDQAIDWSLKVTFNTPDAATQQAFEQWLAANAAHRQAWQRLQSLGGQFAGLPRGAALDTLNKLPEGRLQRRQALKLLALLTGVGVVGWHTAQHAPWQRLMADYSTGIGEHRRWTLDDGSVLDLNTDSAVRVDFGAEQRLLTLLRGELALSSGDDAQAALRRPLRVKTPQCLLECQDAQLEARLNGDATWLWVAQGRVQVSPLGRPDFTVQAGEGWRIGHRQAVALPATTTQRGAWRDGMFIARDLPLREVVEELDRYQVGHVGCDPRIAQVRLSGNFSTERPDQALVLIAQSHGWQLRRLTRFWVRLAPA